MRIIILFLLVSLMANAVTAQPPVKKTATSKQPSKSEINAGMQEIVNDLKKQIAEQEKQISEVKKNKEDAESIKEMEDGLEMLKKQLSSIQNISKSTSLVSDKAFEEAMNKKEENGIPKRDDLRIKSLPDKVLTDAELASFIKKVTAEVEKKIPAKEKTKVEELYNIAKTISVKELAGIANTFWINGNQKMALYFMGKACLSDMNDAENLNSYASFLSMSGGEHAALPILQNLDQKFPDNSTILNNIGQAWYGLGEMNNANRYLDKCLMLYGNHSQANQTKAIIQKEDGKTQEAIESIKKSIRENYTEEKEIMLEELGGKLEYDDVPFPYPIKKDALGLEKFTGMIPDYPLTLGDADLNNERWKEFKKAIGKVSEKMQPEIEQKKSKMSDFLLRTQGDATVMQPYNNHVWKRAVKKLKLLDEWFVGELEMLTRKQTAVQDSADAWYRAYYDIVAKSPGCAVLNAAAVDYMSKSNSLLKPLNHQRVVALKYYTEQAANIHMYLSTDQSVYDFMIISLKAGFLAQLGSLDWRWMSTCLEANNQQTIPGMTLPDFDELNCEYKSELFIPPFTTIKIECNKMTTSFDVSVGLGPKFKVGIEENLSKGEYTRGTAEIGFSKSIDKVSLGPLKVEAKAEIAAGIEITQEGVSDVYAKAGVTGKVGSNFNTEVKNGQVVDIPSSDPRYFKDKSGTAVGVEVKMGWNSGATLSGKGLLKSINVSSTR